MAHTKKGLELAFRLRKYLPITVSDYTILKACSNICRAGTTLNRIAERLCNEDMSEKETARVDKQESQMEKTIEKELGLLMSEPDVPEIKVVYGGDPRGPVVTLIINNGKYNHEIFVA